AKAMSDRYKLEGHKAVAVDDLLEWGRWLQTADRRVGLDIFGDIRVSTVFLGLDHSFGGGAPLLFETMVFGGPLAGEQERYSTWEQAEAGHKLMVEKVRPAPAASKPDAKEP